MTYIFIMGIMKTCSIDGCEKKVNANGLCWMHYSRVRNGKTDMRPGRLPWSDNDIRYQRMRQFCSIPGCLKSHYAKGYCRYHYELNRIHGTPYYKKPLKAIINCCVLGCDEIATVKEMCKFHRERWLKGTELTRPKGNSGHLNVQWKGGVAQYPNHHEMKKMRKIVLKESKYKCHFCGKPANEIHHEDLSKDNHSRGNLVACCRKCNAQYRKPHTSKFKRMYGKTMKNIVKDLKLSYFNVMRLHRTNRIFSIITTDGVRVSIR